MCGIYALISATGYRKPDQKLQNLLCKRGPDHIGHTNTQIPFKNGSSYWVSLTSTVLALRGGLVTSQPFVDPSTQSSFCWNGEAWKIGAEPVEGNDGQAVFESLVGACSVQITASKAIRETLKVLRGITGPFAFFFLDKVHSQIYFGRDRLGRRSLLFRIRDDSIEFASVADSVDASWCEVEADGIYRIALSEEVSPQISQNRKLKDGPALSLGYPSEHYSWDAEDSLTPSLGIFNKVLPGVTSVLNTQSLSVQILREQLTDSLKLRVLNVPVPPGLDREHNVRIAVLFSGGLDCTVLARLACDILPSEQHIDLINVAFENPRVVQAAKKASQNIVKSMKTQVLEDKVQVNGTHDSEIFSQNLELSAYEKCPDRETGRKAFQELKTICPGRVWRFIAVNVPYTETLAHRDTVVGLIHPHNTEMDLSIAYALYFAARGTGISTENEPNSSAAYTTPARVLLSGLGADELFGGYTRHATAFNRHGCEGILDELELDVNRLGKRNLGRDDRVISHWGKEARFPYLDESLVKWAVECPIWEKYGFQSDVANENGVPEIESGKKVLRLLAYTLGMHSVAQEKKRAIQFGARTAKMEVGRTKGTQLIS